MRNFQIGTRAPTANVKLADLVKIDRLANNTGGVNVNPIVPILTNSAGSDPLVSTWAEDKFINNYDKYLTAKNLQNYSNQNINSGLRRTVPKPIITAQGDPRVINIIPGNNDIPVKDLLLIEINLYY